MQITIAQLYLKWETVNCERANSTDEVKGIMNFIQLQI